MTEAIYLEVTEMAETAHKAKRRVSVSGMLKEAYEYILFCIQVCMRIFQEHMQGMFYLNR